MFDVGFWELGLIMLIALLVVGPERLPALARTVGAWIGKLRRMVSDVKAEVDRELRADALRESLGKNALEDLRQAAKEAKKIGDDLRSDVQSFGASKSSGEPTHSQPGSATKGVTADDPNQSSSVASAAVAPPVADADRAAESRQPETNGTDELSSRNAAANTRSVGTDTGGG